MNAADLIWERMRLTPARARVERWPVVRYDPGFAAWQAEHEEIPLAMRRLKRALIERFPKRGLCAQTQAELPL